MLLVERVNELRTLDHLGSEAREGNGGLVVIAGVCGTGKTSLLKEFGNLLPRAVEFLSATGSAAESAQQLGVLAQLLQNSRSDDTTPSPWATVQVLVAEAAECSEEEPELLLRIGAAVADVARRIPVVIAVDDVQSADAATLQVLSYLLRRLPFLRLLIAVTENVGWNPAASPFRSELIRNPRVSRIELGPLTLDGVMDVLRDRVGEMAAARIGAECYELTGGNPLLVREVAEHCGIATGPVQTDSGADNALGGSVVRGGLGRAVVALCHSTGGAALDVATGIAVLGRYASVDRISRLVGEQIGVVEWIIDSFTAAGLTKGARFRSAALGTPIIDLLQPQERVDLHSKAAWLLHDERCSTVDIAGHLLKAGRVSESWAYQVLRDAASDALDSDDHDFGLSCLKLAADWCQDEDERADLGMTRFTAEWVSEPGLGERWFDSLVVSLRTGHLHGPRALQFVGYLIWHGMLEDAVECLRLMEDVFAASEQSRAAETQAIQGWLEFVCPPLFVGDRPWCDEISDSVARPVPAGRRVRALGITHSVMREGPGPQTASAIEEILNGWTITAESVEAAACALLALSYAGRVDLADSWCDSFLRDTMTRRTTTWIALLSAVKALIADRRGRPLEAERHALRAMELISSSGWGVGICVPLAVLISSCAVTGRAEAAATWLNHPIPDAAFQTHFGLIYLHARGEYQLSVGRPDAALADLNACGELMGRWGIDMPGYLPWRTSAASAHLLLGDPAQARKLIDEQRGRPGGDLARVRAVSLRVSAATRPLRERPALLQEALTILIGEEESVEAIRVLIELAQAFRDLGL